MRLHSRIFILVLLMLVGLGVTNGLYLYDSARENVEQDVEESLLLAERSFVDSFDSRQRYLINSVQTVVNDWGLRQAVAQQDRHTAESVLVNHGRRVGADVALIIGKDRKILASTLGSPADLSTNVVGRLGDGSETVHLFARIGQHHFQLVLAEVRAPVPVGWLGMGFLIDDALARHFSRLSDVEVSFAQRSDSGIEFFASSLADRVRFDAASETWLSGPALWRVSGNGWEDLALYHGLDETLSGMVVILQKSLSEPLAEFQVWWWSIATIFAFIAVLALVIAYLFSLGITRPLNQLLRAIEDIEAGDYSTSIDVQRRDEIGSLSKSFIRMQSAIAEREEEIRFRADHDPITGVLNRYGFLGLLNSRIAVAETQHTPLTVVCIRLNHFTQIIDALGHAWGDRLLKLVAERLAGDYPESGLAHVNADEFVLVLCPDNVSEVFSIGEGVYESLTADFNIRGISLTLTANVGISVFPEHASDGQNLLRRATVALNESIQRRQRTVVYDPNLDQNSVKRLTLMSELPRAIKEDQLSLHYQPKVRCTGDGHALEAVECLVRWNHPELGFVPPDEFIGLAEKTGYIVELTQFVLQQAIAQCSEWRRQNIKLGVAVNISAVDLQRSSLAIRVQELLERHCLPAEALCLEITESTVMEDPDSALEKLLALRNLGIRLSIDDYGTGYSSLAQLKKLPVHELKIDKNFVMELDRSEDDQTIVHSTIELAHNIGLQVVAEGVESSRILWQLNQWGADYAQGFFISKPLSLTQMNLWLETTDYPVNPVVKVIPSDGRISRSNR